ncbi:Inner membrane protein yfeZ [Raoultella terrigena]|uniref:Inner membrane protein yfeZ n=1 Tax=Raoultella terrigena TaxID=577 RepID=A0A4U9D4W1_RAOTE|nr:Inner membrane protein yfeZ [Raoultella terrigena]
MKNTELIPADFDAHGRLRLPFLFWCVLLLQARTWVLFIMAGGRGSRAMFC